MNANIFGDNIKPFSSLWWVQNMLPWMVGILIFGLVSYTFFAPQFDDKSLSQGDITNYAGMSHDIHEHREASMLTKRVTAAGRSLLRMTM